MFNGQSALHGTVVFWGDPLFAVRFDCGATTRLNAKTIVEALVFDPADVCDPTRFYYGFERFHPASVEGCFCTDGLELPPDWLGDDAADPAADGHAAYGGSAPALTVVRE